MHLTDMLLRTRIMLINLLISNNVMSIRIGYLFNLMRLMSPSFLVKSLSYTMRPLTPIRSSTLYVCAGRCLIPNLIS